MPAETEPATPGETASAGPHQTTPRCTAGGGSDVANIQTTAVLEGDHYIVNGSKTFITNGQRIIDADGNSLGAVVAIHDITERKKAEKELTNYRKNLEEIIKKRTLELEEKNKKLDKLNKVFVGREIRMAELKKEIKKMKENNNF